MRWRRNRTTMMHVYTHTYKHTQMYTHTHIHTHTRTHRQPMAKINMTYRLSHSLEGGKRNKTTETGLDASRRLPEIQAQTGSHLRAQGRTLRLCPLRWLPFITVYRESDIEIHKIYKMIHRCFIGNHIVMEVMV